MAELKSERTVPERHEVKIMFLEQTAPPRVQNIARPARNVAILNCAMPPVAFYRHLYNAVGEPHKWVSRRYMPDKDLLDLIHQDNALIYVLYVDGWPAGFTEIDTADDAHPAIRFFGLIPEAQGLGLGRWFFHEVLGMIWAKGPKSIRIDTCSMDSPSALRLYQRAGFNVIDQASGVIEWYG